MQRVQTRPIMLEVTHAVEIKRGVVLLRGHHLRAIEVRIGLETVSGWVSWEVPRYTIEFTADELASMGDMDIEGIISDEIDVTEFVHSGELIAT